MPSDVVRGDASVEDTKLIQLVLDHKEHFQRRRWIFERGWYQNILFYLGNQWIIFEDTFRRWRKRNMPNWVPLPVTNRLASTANVIRASVAQVQPAFTAYPTQENERSILSANAADKYLDIIMQESGFRGARRRMASWVTLTGNGFLLQEFDTSPDTGMAFIPGEKCSACGFEMAPKDIPANMTCPRCGGKELVEAPELGISVPQGRLRTRALSPFEVYVDNTIQELEDQPAVMVAETVHIDWVRQTYGKKAEEVTPDNEREIGRFFLDSLAHMTGTGYGAGSGGRSEAGEDFGGVTLYRLFVKTHKDFPNGIYVVMSGDQRILEAHKPYPFRYSHTKKPFYPMVHIRYDDVPGRFWAKTPIDDLVGKQRQRNELESLYQVIIMRCANPIWLLPTGVTTTPITGDPGIAVRYSGAGGAKPERIPGVDAPPTVIKFIEMIDNDFEELANTFAVMKGKNPGSIRAASAIQMLVERGFGRYGSVFDNLEEAYEQWAVQALEIWRQRTIFPRVQAIAKTAGAFQFMEFLGSDIGEIDIRVEAGSTRPRSQAGRQMLIGQAIQWGLINPNDPEQKMKIFEELGMLEILPGAAADVKVVAEENARFMAWALQVSKELGDGTIPPEQALVALQATNPLAGMHVLDHHPTHMVHHRRFGLSEQFRALPEPLQMMFVQHILTAHLMPLMAELQTGIGLTGVVAGMTGPPLPQQGPGGGTLPGASRPATGGGPGKQSSGSQGPFGSDQGGQQ